MIDSPYLVSRDILAGEEIILNNLSRFRIRARNILIISRLKLRARSEEIV